MSAAKRQTAPALVATKTLPLSGSMHAPCMCSPGCNSIAAHHSRLTSRFRIAISTEIRL